MKDFLHSWCFVKVSSLSPAFKTNFCVSAFAAVSTWAAVTHHPWREQTRGTAPWATSAAPYPRMTGPLPSPHWPAASTLWSVVLIFTRLVAVLKPSRSCDLRISFTPHRTFFFGSVSDPGAVLQRGEDHLRCRSFEDGFQSGAQQFEAGGEEFDVLIDLFFFRVTVLKCNANSLAPGPAHIPRHGLFRDGPSSQQPGGGRGARCLGIHQQSD